MHWEHFTDEASTQSFRRAQLVRSNLRIDSTGMVQECELEEREHPEPRNLQRLIRERRRRGALNGNSAGSGLQGRRLRPGLSNRRPTTRLLLDKGRRERKPHGSE